MENALIIDTIRHDTTRHDTPLLSVIMPSISADIGTLINNSEFYFRFLPIKNIYIAGPASISETVKNAGDSRLVFMNENEFCDIQRLREIYLSRTSEDSGRVGWYVQQFIKMQFSRFTYDEYYLIWDSDTLPLKPTILFDISGKPYFDMKTEYYSSYFDTISRILPGITKAINKSFISEHMVIRREYMLEMINEIEASGSLDGNDFQEMILNSVDTDYLTSTGFSEYETYGSFTITRHPGSYAMRDWCSLRPGKRLWDNAASISEEEIRWLATRYDALTIEKRQIPTKMAYLAKSRLFRALFPPTSFEHISKIARTIMPKKYRVFIKSIPARIKSLITK